MIIVSSFFQVLNSSCQEEKEITVAQYDPHYADCSDAMQAGNIILGSVSCIKKLGEVLNKREGKNQFSTYA
jgi:hypothetical protein